MSRLNRIQVALILIIWTAIFTHLTWTLLTLH
jgi:hypothetical protein